MKGRSWVSSVVESFEIRASRAGRSSAPESFKVRAGRFIFLRGCSDDDVVERIEDVKKTRIQNPEALSSLIAMAKDKLFDQGT
jgi:hypothetical protein